MKKKQERQTQPTGRAYQVTITETRRRTVTVYESELKVPTPDDAEQTVSDWWHNGQIILVTEDFSGVEFEAKEVTETEKGGGGNGCVDQVQH